MALSIDGTGNGTIGNLSVTTATGNIISSGDSATITAGMLDGGQSGSAPVYACRAWVNFNGTGTPAIRASGNVSSITDNGTGDFTVNFSTAMEDANYSVVARASIGNFGSSINITDFNVPATSSIRYQTRFHNGSTEGGLGTAYDYAYNFAVIIR